MSLMTGKHVIKSYKMNHFKITINIIHLLKQDELFYVYLHAIWPLTNVREPQTCKRYTYSNIYFKISGVLKEVIGYDFIFLTLVSV